MVSDATPRPGSWFADTLKRFAAAFPQHVQQDLKRRHFRRLIRTGRFEPGEPEFQMLPALIRPGDWVIDVGANIGFYTLRLAELVGPEGRVLAFEPIPANFELLAANCGFRGCRNVTLFNVAASRSTGLVRMEVPTWGSAGMTNPYRARITAAGSAGNQYAALAVAIDSLQIPARVSLVKIDVEGHELEVVHGMKDLIARHRPALLIEGTECNSHLEGLSYRVTRLPGSPNCVLTYGAAIESAHEQPRDPRTASRG